MVDWTQHCHQTDCIHAPVHCGITFIDLWVSLCPVVTHTAITLTRKTKEKLTIIEWVIDSASLRSVNVGISVTEHIEQLLINKSGKVFLMWKWNADSECQSSWLPHLTDWTGRKSVTKEKYTDNITNQSCVLTEKYIFEKQSLIWSLISVSSVSVIPC